MMSDGRLPYNVMTESFGVGAYRFLTEELKKSMEIQIPLYCGQKRNITEEKAKCCIISTLTTKN